ncbi:hypothetical protein BRD19_10095 [Halobacteriales archaeon SW_7_65_23]|nr:MAG: hypothetical protein BRD19_10095 [Halobacteriales archaeon SW_7_65_23]
MDRIATLRTIEEALSEYEEGDLSLPELEREVRGTLRTYATEFADAAAYRARGDPGVDGLVVVADSPTAARERIAELVDDPGPFELERVDET